MKTIFPFVCATVIILTIGHSKPCVITTSQFDSRVDSVYFKTTIQPVLVKNCSPCHFPGGKMYEKMPFDKGETIVNHEAGALKRFNDKPELSLIKKFIEESKLQ